MQATMKIYGFVYNIENNSSCIYFPTIGKFGLLQDLILSKNTVFEFEKTEDNISNPSKCINVEIDYGEITDISLENYKVRSSNDTIYSLPISFFIPSDDKIKSGMKVRLYKNNIGILIYGEIFNEIILPPSLEEIYPETIGTKLPLKSMKNLFKYNQKII